MILCVEAVIEGDSLRCETIAMLIRVRGEMPIAEIRLR